MPRTIVRASPRDGATLSTDQCLEILGRVCFGHLAFARGRHIGVLPVRYALEDGWVYFRAETALRESIARSPWLCLSITELHDESLHTSVVVRGGCYATEDTGSAESDAASLRGIVALRDRARVGPRTTGRQYRSLGVFRMRVEELEGSVTLVPCPAGQRPYDEAELEYLRAAAREQGVNDDSRADDDGMATANAPVVSEPDATRAR